MTLILQTPRPRPLTRRRRRIALTIFALAAAAIGGTWIGFRIHRAHAPKPYEPGETNPEITRSLAQPYEQGRAVSQPATPAKPAEAAEGLRNPGQPLPAGAPAPALVDVTAAAGLSDFRSFAGARTSQLPEDMGSGAAWGDFDNDGNEDLFLVSAGGPLGAPPEKLAPSLLYRNLGNGTFRRVEDFPDLRILGMGAAWGDYDNDGWLDLVVTGFDTLLLFHNDHGRLVRDNRMPNLKGFWTGASWGDYDRDGNLDLYVCGYVDYAADPRSVGTATRQFGLEVPYTLNPSSFTPARNLLFHNNGDGTFTEVAAKLGVSDPQGRSLSALWHDFDGDGWLDLYVANDVSENKFYLNRHGTFVDAGSEAWIAEYRGSMGLAAGDWDGDGDDDLFISHWVAQQYALYNSLLSEQARAAKRSAEVAATSKQLHFMDVAEMTGIGQISLRTIGWGAEFADFDGDGWLDLAVANGSTFETHDRPPRLERMESFLFWNNRGKSFYNLAPWNKSFSTPHTSRGLAVADYDNDGALDLLIVDHGEGVRLLRNRMQKGNWAELRLRNRVGASRRPVGFGDGATVIATAGQRILRRTVGGASYLSQSSRRIHFGLGSASKLDSLEVRWPGGHSETYDGIGVNAAWELTEGDPAPRRLFPAAAAPSVAGVAKPLPGFWDKEHAAMDAMKKDGDYARAARLFREALAMNPSHEDSHYYLANCLAAQGDSRGAIAQLDELVRLNPGSHRAWLRRGSLLAASATSRDGLRAAADSVEKALAINPEETGAMMLLGEIAIVSGDYANAARRFQAVSRTNPRAAAALFLGSYIAWKRGDAAEARSLLARTQQARGKEWKPKGSVLEGDVRRRMFTDATFLSSFCDAWDGTPDPARAFRPLDRFLAARPR